MTYAILFTTNGTVELKVTEFWQKNTRSILLAVIDDGIGMSAVQLGKIFTAFAQTDTSTTHQYGGAGLGLTIIRQLAQLMQGDVTVASEVNKGAQFRLTIPCQLSHN